MKRYEGRPSPTNEPESEKEERAIASLTTCFITHFPKTKNMESVIVSEAREPMRRGDRHEIDGH